MGVLMWHPQTGGTFEAASEDAVPHHRASGWLLASEREEHEARAAERRQLEEAERATSKSGKSTKSTEGSA